MAADLISLIGEAKVRSGEAVASLDPGFDSRNLRAGLVATPTSVAEISQLLKFANERGIGIVPHGGRTGLAGGAVSEDGQIVLSLQRLNSILHIDAQGSTAIVEAGVVLHDLDEALQPLGLALGIDLGARGSATIGGMIATNAGGIEAFRNGVMRARVLGLEAVLADGTVVSDLSLVTKCNEGYDVKQLFIGSEGTLGIVTRAALKLVRRPGSRSTALVTTETAAAATTLFRVLEKQKLLAFELMGGRYVRLAVSSHKLEGLASLVASAGFAFIVETEGSEEELVAALELGEAVDAVIAKSDAERQEFWKLREDSWVVDRNYPAGLWFDISVPLADLDDYLNELERRLEALNVQAELFVIGHLGDGNLHLTIAGPQSLVEAASGVTAAVYSGLRARGGSISAEHGIGLEKTESLARLGDPGKLAVMRLVKQSLDPNCIMNPGKVLLALASKL